MLGVSKETTAQEVMQYFGNGAGEVTIILVLLLESVIDAVTIIFLGEIFSMVHQGWRRS